MTFIILLEQGLIKCLHSMPVDSLCCGSNSWTAQAGSATAFINNKPAHRLGDGTQHCGGIGLLLEGSHNVFASG